MSSGWMSALLSCEHVGVAASAPAPAIGARPSASPNAATARHMRTCFFMFIPAPSVRRLRSTKDRRGPHRIRIDRLEPVASTCRPDPWRRGLQPLRLLPGRLCGRGFETRGLATSNAPTTDSCPGTHPSSEPPAVCETALPVDEGAGRRLVNRRVELRRRKALAEMDERRAQRDAADSQLSRERNGLGLKLRDRDTADGVLARTEHSAEGDSAAMERGGNARALRRLRKRLARRVHKRRRIAAHLEEL